MATLLLRLAAPLQAWGAESKFETRKTGREPVSYTHLDVYKRQILQYGVTIEQEIFLE